MNQEDMSYEKIENLVRESANQIPVTYNPNNWEKLANQLNSVPRPSLLSRLVKFISLNSSIILICVSAILFGFLTPKNLYESNVHGSTEQTKKTSVGFKEESALTAPALFKRTRNKTNNMGLPELNATVVSDSEKRDKLEDLELGNPRDTVGISPIIDQENREVVDSVEKPLPFIFW